MTISQIKYKTSLMIKYSTFTLRRKGTELKSGILLKHTGKESLEKRQCPMTVLLSPLPGTQRPVSFCLVNPFISQEVFLDPHCQVQVDTPTIHLR